MAQAIQRIQAMPIDKQSLYYTVEPKESHAIRAKNQVLQVISGVAWVSCGGEDFILNTGDAITLFPHGDLVAMVSGLLDKPMQYTLKF